tara:strand:- start:101 stop:298 length:198 start_codon:yes stop_codon:yes gene_type:complete
MAKMNKKAFQKMVTKNMFKESEDDNLDSILNPENFQSFKRESEIRMSQKMEGANDFLDLDIQTQR